MGILLARGAVLAAGFLMLEVLDDEELDDVEEPEETESLDGFLVWRGH
jgi:hypothetical protein